MTSSFSRKPNRTLSRVARVLVVVGLLLGLAGVAVHAPGVPSARGVEPFATGGPGGGGGATELNVTVNMTDAPAFVPALIVTQGGDTVHLTIHNVGAFDHTFTLSNTPNVTVARNATPQVLDAFFAAKGTWVNLSLAPGASGAANLSIPSNLERAGFFFASVVPFQFQAGMSGWLNVTPRPSGPPVVLTVNAVGSGFNFVPNILEVNTSSLPVAVAVQAGNLGSTSHTWTLSPFANYNLSAANFTDFFAAHPPLADVNLPTTPGNFLWANFTITQKGVYQFICTIPGHFQAGMFGYLYVGVNVTPPPAPLSSDIVQIWVLIGAGALLGVGVLVAVVAALSGRVQTAPAPPKH